MSFQTRYMRRAMELAESARGKTLPNPNVGAVVVLDGKIVGEGLTQPCGGNHAEVQALLKAGKLSRNAELYVTLEPCSHWGRTPPCTDAIIWAGISTVYAGIPDPNPEVDSQAILKEAGIGFQIGFLSEEISRQLETYLIYMSRKSPFDMLKTAMSLDGCIATKDGESCWITGEESRGRVHELRTEYDAILTGIGTVLSDNPRLNVRLDGTFRQPVRVILDPDLLIPLDCNIARSAANQRTIVFCGKDTSGRWQLYSEVGIEIVPLTLIDEKFVLNEVLKMLHQREIGSVMLETGARLTAAFVEAELVDKYELFIAPRIIGNGLKAFGAVHTAQLVDALQLQITQQQTRGFDWHITAYPVRSKK
ncbi:MAG: bifunctional diaminohydroxyphosphoribosylaminopyrimidine deaminase/5-amino-6-(5-phosphoribosylamino)uracil reductase RibD [Candidatus Cloacimonetes bacterium]|nr:bifunctional diaminohydroxyphosphoribosylaminopyrimidine deaminase/5-amino-6-(5-phosphoribosylamino)uracil reductase RibD [Candidatus Cloacimonadota bacterium]